MTKLNNAISKMLQNPYYAKLYNYMVSKGISIASISINASLSVNGGGYLPNSNTMVYQSEANITNNFVEEYLHFCQNNVYSGGTSQYTNSASGNIEFEVKLMQDVLCYCYTGI